MMSKTFADAWKFAFELSPLPPYLNSELSRIVEAHYAEHTLLVTNLDREMRDYIYSSEVNGNVFAVAALSYVDEEYKYFVLKTDKYAPDDCFRVLISSYKESGKYADIPEMVEMIQKIQAFKRIVRDILENCIRSKRRASGKVIDFSQALPTEDVLQDFYECGRKVKFSSLAEAEKNNVQPVKQQDEDPSFPAPYYCDRCSEWHLGHQPSGIIIPHTVMVGRWKTAWKRANMNVD